MFFTAVAADGAAINGLKLEVRIDGVGGPWSQDTDLTSCIQESPRLGNAIPNTRSDVIFVIKTSSEDFMCRYYFIITFLITLAPLLI